MRYISKYKIFEASSPKMYKYITEQEYNFGTKPNIDFESRYADMINVSMDYMVRLMKDGGHIILYIDSKHNDECLSINQTEDEYFIIFHDDGDDWMEYYVCDQIEGLLQYLEDNGILK